MRHALAPILLVLITRSALAAPEALIVQRLLADKTPATNLRFATELANELDAEGRVVPIVWSMSDAIFRTYVDENRIRVKADDPSDDEIASLAKRMKVAYVILLSAEKKEGRVIPYVELFRGADRRAVWTFGDKERKSAGNNPKVSVTVTSVVLVNGLPDWENTSRSLAYNLVMQLGREPFKSLTPHTKRAAPEPEKGALPPAGEPVKLPEKPAPLDQTVLTRVDALLKQGLQVEAMNLLRDAVDAAPFDAARRERLIKLLLERGETEEAADEARRACRLAPERIDFKVLAVRSWLALGQLTEAESDLNDVLARGGGSPEVQTLRAELFMARGEPGKALEAYTAASSGGPPRYDAALGKALAVALSGEAEQCARLMGSLPEASESERLVAYRWAMRTLEGVVDKAVDAVRTAMQLGRSSPKAPETIAAGQRSEKLAAGLATFATGLTPPGAHKASHERRDLALKLLAQAATEASAYDASGDEDTGTEAALSLGEALKQLRAVQQQYQQELKG